MTRAQYDAMTDQQRLDYIQLLESMVDDARRRVPVSIELHDDVPAYIVNTLIEAGIEP